MYKRQALGAQGCTDYPANGSVTFKVNLYDENLKPVSNPAWIGTFAGSRIEPQCGFAQGIAPKRETIYYAVTYSYVGKPYQFIKFSSPGVCPLTGYFTTAQPLPPNWFGNVTPTNVKFTDCVSTVTSFTTYGAGIWVSTDSQGQIETWSFNFNPSVNVLVKKDDGTSFTAPSWQGEGQCCNQGNFNALQYCSADGEVCAWAEGAGDWKGGSAK